MSTPTKRFYEVAFCAKTLGLGRDNFIAGCDSGELPIKIYRIGQRPTLKVDAIQFLKFAGERAPASLRSLFADE